MIIDKDNSGYEQAHAELMRYKSYRPFCSTWFAIKVNGEWQMFSAVRGVTQAIRSADKVCPEIIYGQKVDSYARTAFRKAFMEAMQ